MWHLELIPFENASCFESGPIGQKRAAAEISKMEQITMNSQFASDLQGKCCAVTGGQGLSAVRW
jgi:hypothetical protein